MSLFSIVVLSVVLMLGEMQANRHFDMNDKDEYHFDIDQFFKPLQNSVRRIGDILNDMTFGSNEFQLLKKRSMEPDFVPSLVRQFNTPADTLKQDNNLPNRVRRKSQNATDSLNYTADNNGSSSTAPSSLLVNRTSKTTGKTIETHSLNYTVHDNVSSSTTPPSLLVNQTSKTREKNRTSEKHQTNNITSSATPFAVGKTVEYSSTNATTNLTKITSSDMATFNSPDEKEEERREKMFVDVWIMGSLLFFVFFILAAADYYYRRNIGSQTRRAGDGVPSMSANNSSTEPVV